MELQRFLHLLFLTIISDTIAAGIGGYLLWRHRRNNGVSSVALAGSVLLLSLCFEGLMILSAHSFGFEVRPHYSTGYAVSFWVGRTTRSLALWAFVLIMIAGRKPE